MRSAIPALAAIALLVRSVMSQTLYDVYNGSSVTGVFYPTISALTAMNTDSASLTYLETAPSSGTPITRTRVQYSSSNSYRLTQVNSASVNFSSTVTVIPLTTIYNGECYYTLSVSTGSASVDTLALTHVACSDTWAYLFSTSIVAVQTAIYGGTVTSQPLGQDGNYIAPKGSSGLSGGAIAGIVVGVVVVVVFTLVGIFLLVRRQRQNRVRRSLSGNGFDGSAAARPVSGASSFGTGHERVSSGDARPISGQEQPGGWTQFSIGEDLHPDVHDRIAGSPPTSPTRSLPTSPTQGSNLTRVSSGGIPRQSRVPVPSFDAP